MALADQYDGFIFDYGGVLVTHQTPEDQRRLAQIARVPVETFTELYWAERARYDKGELTADEYWRGLARNAGSKPFDSDIVDKLTEADTRSWMHFDAVMWDWLKSLKASGKRLAVLSNMPRDLGEVLKSRTDRFNQFDHVTLSYEVNAVKPEPAIYEHCLEGLNISAERTLFLDDRMENVRGAELLGITATQFLDRDEVLLRLR
jgi:putative hydrolase of the HAD superfamily